MSDKKRREFLVRGLTVGATVIAVEAGFPFCMRAAFAADESQRFTTVDGTQKTLKELAYCGFDCEKECYVYRATRENDMKVKAEVAERWNRRFGAGIKPEDVACDGCRADGRLGYHCEHVCDVRKCGIERSVESCATCGDFPACDKELWKNWKEMHARTAERYELLHS